MREATPMLSVMVIPTPIPIEEYEAFQFTTENAQEVQMRCNAVLFKDDPGNSKTWRLTILTCEHKPQQAKIGDWIVAKSGYHRVYTPEEFHRLFTITSSPGRSRSNPVNKTIQAIPSA